VHIDIIAADPYTAFALFIAMLQEAFELLIVKK
jgi:hypothetical protein